MLRKTYLMPLALIAGCAPISNYQDSSPNHIERSDQVVHIVEDEPEVLEYCGAYKISDIEPYGLFAEFECHEPMFSGADYPVETGIVNGIKYSIYHSDRSAGFYSESEKLGSRDFDVNWSVDCETDPIDDSRQCTISRTGFMLFIYNNTYSISASGNTYPGTSVSFRVDNRPPITVNEDSGLKGESAKALVQEMRNGSRLVTRYYDWPHHASRVNEMSANGFDEAYQYMLSIK